MSTPHYFPCRTFVHAAPRLPRIACPMASACGSAPRARPRGLQCPMPLALRQTHTPERECECESGHPCAECWLLSLTCCCAAGAWVCCAACVWLGHMRCRHAARGSLCSCAVARRCVAIVVMCGSGTRSRAHAFTLCRVAGLNAWRSHMPLTSMMVRNTECACLVGCSTQRCGTLAAAWGPECCALGGAGFVTCGSETCSAALAQGRTACTGHTWAHCSSHGTHKKAAGTCVRARPERVHNWLAWTTTCSLCAAAAVALLNRSSPGHTWPHTSHAACVRPGAQCGVRGTACMWRTCLGW